jgi:hypothetical protein
MSARNICIDAVTAEMRAAGITYEITHGGKHMQVQWSTNGKRRLYVVPRTPSDWRAAQNARAGIRRLLRKEGLLVRAAPRKQEDDNDEERRVISERRSNNSALSL